MSFDGGGDDATAERLTPRSGAPTAAHCVVVEGVAEAVDLEQICDFFAFCGPRVQAQFLPPNADGKRVLLVFAAPASVRTAQLLSGSCIGEHAITVRVPSVDEVRPFLDDDRGLPAGASALGGADAAAAGDAGAAGAAPAAAAAGQGGSITREAEAGVRRLLEKGAGALGGVLNRAKAKIDESERLSAVRDKVQALGERAKGVAGGIDARLHVRDKVRVVEQRANELSERLQLGERLRNVEQRAVQFGNSLQLGAKIDGLWNSLRGKASAAFGLDEPGADAAGAAGAAAGTAAAGTAPVYTSEHDATMVRDIPLPAGAASPAAHVTALEVEPDDDAHAGAAAPAPAPAPSAPAADDNAV